MNNNLLIFLWKMNFLDVKCLLYPAFKKVNGRVLQKTCYWWNKIILLMGSKAVGTKILESMHLSCAFWNLFTNLCNLLLHFAWNSMLKIITFIPWTIYTRVIQKFGMGSLEPMPNPLKAHWKSVFPICLKNSLTCYINWWKFLSILFFFISSFGDRLDLARAVLQSR